LHEDNCYHCACFKIFTFLSYHLIFKLFSENEKSSFFGKSPIFISDGQVVSADFDFSLLYRLIRNLLTTIPVLAISAPRYGWGEQPSTYYLNEADNIEKNRHLRNVLARSSNLEINDEDFSIHWYDLSQVKYFTITILHPFVDLSQVK
jgi:hypothetical protein